MNDKIARKGFALHEKLIALKRSIGLHFLEVGKVLHEIREGGYWQNMEHSWEAYCLSPEVSISPSHARNLIRIYRRFVLELGVKEDDLADIDPRKLTAIIPTVSKENAEDLLSSARTLSRMDLTRQLKSGTDHTCDMESISYRRCKICYEREGSQ